MIKIGSAGWIDLTVENPSELKDFYSQVIGFEPEDVSMGDYNDFNMNSPTTGDAQVGICHSRAGNLGIPPVWMVYFHVQNMDKSIAKLKELGGQVIGEVKSMGKDKYAFIKDPHGIACALYEKNI